MSFGPATWPASGRPDVTPWQTRLVVALQEAAGAIHARCESRAASTSSLSPCS
jgi:hypothetical protein